MKLVEIIDPIQDPRWDRFVNSSPSGWFCHLSSWKKVLERTFRQLRGHYIAIIDKNNDNIIGGVPIYSVNSWLTGKRLVSIPFTTINSILINSEEDFKKIFTLIDEIMENTNSRYVELRTLKKLAFLKQIHFLENVNYSHHYIKLSTDTDKIFKQFHYKAVKYAINKANKCGLQVEKGKNTNHLKIFYDLYFNTRKKLRLPPQPYDFFHNIWEEFYPKNIFHLILAKKNDKYIAVLAFFKFKERVSTEFAGWDINYSAFNPNHFLYWCAIQEACKEGYKIFDFGRTDKQNKGLMNFKKRWGTHEIDMPIYFYPNYIKAVTKDNKNTKSYKMIQKLCDPKMPDIISDRIGKFCYKHLS